MLEAKKEIEVNLGDKFQLEAGIYQRYKIDSLMSEGAVHWMPSWYRDSHYPARILGHPIKEATDGLIQIKSQGENIHFPTVTFYFIKERIDELIENNYLELLCLLTDDNSRMSYFGTMRDGPLCLLDLMSKNEKMEPFGGVLIEFWRPIEDLPGRLETVWKRKMGKDYSWCGEGEILLVPQQNSPQGRLNMSFNLLNNYSFKKPL